VKTYTKLLFSEQRTTNNEQLSTINHQPFFRTTPNTLHLTPYVPLGHELFKLASLMVSTSKTLFTQTYIPFVNKKIYLCRVETSQISVWTIITLIVNPE